jgi:pheromone shutdown-related protein TraB
MIHHLATEDKDIILIGTAHVSKESVALVESVIDEEKPDTVSIELCASRYESLRSRDQWLNTDIVKVIKEKKAFLLLSHLLLASFQKRIARRLDIKPGEEMIRAISAADQVGADIHLADRDVRVTLSRTWRAMGLWDKLKLLFQLILSMGEADEISAEDVEKMKQQDVLTAVLADMGKSFPVISRIIIDERDQYLSQRIREAPGKKIVAVVGAGHVEGIKKYWDVETDLAPLKEIPPAGKIIGLLKWLLPLLIVGIFCLGFFYGGVETGKNMLIWWVLANGILAGLGALLALGHPLTIITSVLAAPLTSLNPLMAAGWVSGLVEAISRKPKVKDVESLQTDILSIKGFWRNKVTRILLVVVFTNLGSSLGTFVALPLMMRLV